MTTVIDERVVEMRFNNEDFEKNVAQSMSTLDKLKKSLDFDSAKSLENLGKATKGIDLSKMTASIAEATTKFSALEIAGITALANITNKAVDFGLSFVRSVSLDQVTSGFDKYATKTQSVQTIMSATADQFKNQAEQMDYVMEQLDKLTWFTDETSYSMIDMTSNIGKFVSNNIPLEDAVTAMEGIATWAGLSGANVNEASRAMYNFSQAMGAGAMKLMDWKSIENANMATAKFKETAIETAVEMGKLKKSADGLVTTLDDKAEVSVTSFSESLKQKWFDTEVMTATLGKFGKFADELYNLSDATGLTASELLESLDEFKAGTLDLNEIAKDSTMSITDLNEKFKELTGEGFELGKKAFAASQEAKTFKEAIDSVKDAVSSGWMNTFEIIFGNYLEAKKLWTALANTLYDMFAEGGNKRNEVLKVWKELGGRNSLIRGAVEALNLLVKPINVIKEAFESVLPKGREFGKILNQLSYKFYIFMSRLQPSEELLNNLYQFFKGVFSIGKVLLQFFSQLASAVVKLVSPAKSLIELIGSFLGKVGVILQVVSIFISSTGLIQTAVSFIILGIQKLAGVVKTVAMIFAGGLLTGIKLFIDLIRKATAVITTFINAAGSKLAGIGAKISGAFSKVTSIFDKFSKIGNKNSKVTKEIGKNYTVAGKAVGKFGTVTKDASFQVAKEATLLDRFLEVVNKAKTVLVAFGTVVGGAFVALGTKIFKFFTDFKQRYQDITAGAKKWTDYIKGVFETIGSLFADGWAKVKEFFSELGIDLSTLQTAFATVKDGLTTIIDKLGPGRIAAFAFATALLALVGAAIKLSDSFKSMFGAVTGVFNNINKILKKQFAKSSVVTDLAKAFAIIAGSLTLLAIVDATYHDNLENVSKIMMKLMVAFTACAAALRGLDLLMSKFDINTDFNAINSNILALAGAMTLLVAAFAVMNLVELKDDWLKKLGVMGIMLAGLVTSAVLVSKLAPQLSKGSVLLLSIALSMKLMVDALAKISEKDIDGVNKNLAGFMVLFLGVAALTAAAGKLKLTSALNLLILSRALVVLMPEITEMLKTIAPYLTEMVTRLDSIQADFSKAKEFAKKMFDKANDFFNYLYTRFSETTATTLTLTTMILGTIAGIASLGAVIAGGFALAKIITAIGSLGNIMKGVGIAVIGLAVGVKIVTSSIIELGEYTKYLTDKQYNRLMDSFTRIIAMLMLTIGVATAIDAVATLMTRNLLYDGENIRTNFMGMAAAFVGIGLAMKLIVSSLKGIQDLKEDTFVPVIAAMSVLLLCLGIAAGLSGQITKGGSALLGLIGIAVTMGLLIAELGVLSLMYTPENQHALNSAMLAMLGLFAGLGAVLWAMSKLNTGPVLALVLPIAGVISVLAGVIAFLGSMENVNYAAIWSAVAGIGLVIGELIILFAYITHVRALKETALNNKLQVLGGCITALSVLAVALGGMTAVMHVFGLKNALKALRVLLGGLVLVVGIFSFITGVKALNNEALPRKLKLLWSCIGALGAVAVIIGGTAAAINKIGGNRIWEAFSILSLQLTVIAGIMTWISKMDGLSDDETINKIAMFGAIALALIPLSSAIVKLSQMDMDDNWNSMVVLAAGLTSLAGVLWAVTKITSTLDIGDMVGSIALLAAACGVIWVLGTELAKLAGLDTGQLDAAAAAMQKFAIALGVMLGVLGVIQALVAGVAGAFTAGSGGTAGAYALPALFVAIGIAAAAMGWGFKQASEGVRTIGDAFEDLASSLKTMDGLNLSAIAEGMSQLAVAGLALGMAADSVSAFAGAMGSLASALGSYNSAANGGPGGGGGVTFEYFDDINEGVSNSAKQTENVVKGAYENVKTYDGLITEAVTGVLVNTEEKVAESKYKIFGEVVSPEEEAQLIQNAQELGYKTVEEYIAAIERGEAARSLETESFTERQVKKLANTAVTAAKDTVGPGLEELGGDIKNFFTNGDLAGVIGSAGTMLGKLFGGNMAYNAMQIISQYLGSFDWMFNLETKLMGKAVSKLGANGMPTDVINKMYGGKAYSDQYSMLAKAGEKLHGVNGLLGDDFLFFGDVMDEINDKTKELTDGLGGVGDAAGGAGGKAKAAADDFKEFGDSLKDTISSQLDMFSKFELKMGVSADQMIENMKSNIDGFASWSHRMTVLAERFAEHGISDTLYKKLAELGPKGYETMNAFYEMTDEQLEEVRGLWETGLTLPEGQADIVAAGFQYMGEMSAEGFSNALDEHKAAHAGSMFGKSALKGIADALGIASPSKETFKQGVFVTEGLGNGMTSDSAMSFLEISIQRVTDYILELFNTQLNEDTMAEAGTGILTNLFTGILGEATEENPVMAAFIQTFTEFELIDEALNLFVEHFKELLYELFEIPGDEEPSEWFYRYAMSMLQGMINSFIENEILVKTQIIMFCMNIMQTFDEQDLPQQAHDIGMNIALGLRDGINEYAQEAIDAAQEMAEAIIAILESVPMVKSPSRVTMRIGGYISEGLAIGIADGADNVYKAAQSVAEGSLDAMSDVGRLQEVINEGMDFNPIITPMLDLSLIREQMAELDSMMNDPMYGLEGQNEGGASVKSPSQINFTQNNYSPKALSRIEIYRQTRNQLSQLKGALG